MRTVFLVATLEPGVTARMLLQGWQGAHTLPREVTLDADSRALVMNPVKEVESLRTQLLHNSTLPGLPSMGGATMVIGELLVHDSSLSKLLTIISSLLSTNHCP
jgi:sucrose-6-phosphate hydrolase SacC (GH32 family)